MRGAMSSSCTLLLLLVLPLSEGAPAASGLCSPGCLCYRLPEGGRAANCSRFETARGKHTELPTDLRSIRVLPDAPGLAHFLEERLAHHARHLEELYLTDNEVVGSRLRSLRVLHKLRVLDLSFCELSNTDQIASLVKRSDSLETLRLSGNPLASLPVLVSDTLRDLDVSDCDIASVRADTFTGLRRLRRLTLARNRLTNLAADLPHSLKLLDLSGNSLTHLSPKLVATLHRVDVSGNPLHCTCALLRLREQRTGEHVAVGAGAACTGPEQLRGLSLSGARRLCESRVGSTTGTRLRRQADPLDALEGSGGGEGDGIGEDEELDEETGDDFVDDDYDEEIDGSTGTGGADDASGTSQLGPQNVGVESALSSSSAPPVPASNEDTTRSLEDDIYEPTIPPPVPAAVDADASAQLPSETPPESGPPAAETVEGNRAESAPDETGDVDGISEVPEHKEESEPVAAGFVPDPEGESDVKEEAANTDAEDIFNEVMKNEDEAVDEDEDYDYEEETESTTDEVSVPHRVPLDNGKEGEQETAQHSNETHSSSPETADKKETLDSSPLSPEEDSDKDYEEGEEEIEEKANEVENTDDLKAVHAKVATEESTETTPAPVDTVHTNMTSEAVVPAHDVEPNLDNEEAETDIKVIGEAEGSGEGDSDDSLPLGPITGFIDTNGHDGATTTEEPDERTLLIDEEDEEETDEGDSPLVPPGADDENMIASTEDSTVTESDSKFGVLVNDTERGSSVSPQDDGEEEGSGMLFPFGGVDWDVEKTNETDEAEVTSLGPKEIHEDGLIVNRIIPLESGRQMSSSSESPLTTTTTEKPVGHGGILRLDLPKEEYVTTSEAPIHTVPPVNVEAEGVSSSTAPQGEVEERIATAPPVPAVEAVPSEEPTLPPEEPAVPLEEPALPTAETSPPPPPVLTSEVPVEPGAPEWADKEPTPGPEPVDIDQDEISEVETVMPTDDTSSNDTARVIVAGSEKPPEETPLNSAGSYVVLAIIMALVVFLLGYAVMRSRRGRQRAAAKANGKDAEAAGGQQEGRELKEISKPLLGTPAAVPAANGKGEHLQPLVTKPTDNPDLKDDDGDETVAEKPLLEPKTHIYETLNGGEKERIPVHPPSPKKSPAAASDTVPADGDAKGHTPPVPEKRRVLSRLPETAVDGPPNMYSSDGLPGEVVAQPQQQQPTANGAATSPVNGLSSFAPPVSPSSGRVKVVAREDPDSVPKKPVFVVNQGPSTASGVV
ncbi:titin-like [Schistocerca cancellata]|uniref:titin-like n=1 Tax=Schistocerca cancellata TaxID=274614 RepID=UPI0021182B85|nr:titin-like [Schistocerca cancellata]